ncbi:hypothetical protein [Salinicoccus roseus]|uniref:hypothetical protein n=1 Tax=Salinicoccus roseus TaxID=45670 RepID=UPI002301D0C1|nr:hypothetical protein [Salinicoccus roseus]
MMILTSPNQRKQRSFVGKVPRPTYDEHDVPKVEVVTYRKVKQAELKLSPYWQDM